MAGVFAGYGNSKKANKHKKNVSRFYYQSRKKKLDIPLEALDIMAAKKVYGLKVQQRKILNTKLRFPEKTFNKLMQKKLKWLDKLNGKAGSVQSIGSGEGIISAYEILINTTEKFAKEIESFTPPKKSAAYIKGFKKSMAGVYKPLLQTAKNYRKELWSNIKQNEILSTRNSAFAPANLGVPINYWFPKGGVLMDRGGQR